MIRGLEKATGNLSLTMTTDAKVKYSPQEFRRLIPCEEETTMELINRFIRDEGGASAVEYALLLSLIALAIITSVTTFGQALKGSFETSTTKMFGSGTG